MTDKLPTIYTPVSFASAMLPNGYAWQTDCGESAIVYHVNHPGTTTRLNDGAIITVSGKRLHGIDAAVALALIDAAGRNTTADALRACIQNAEEMLRSCADNPTDAEIDEVLDILKKSLEASDG